MQVISIGEMTQFSITATEKEKKPLHLKPLTSNYSRRLEGGRSGKADHPNAICFLYSIYMQKVVLVPSAGIFLADRYKDGGGSFGG